MAVATDCNPGTSPLTSLLLAMNMAATLFRLTAAECLAGVTREAARALGRLDEIGTLEAGKWCDLAVWDVERPAELRLPHGLQPAARAGVEGAYERNRHPHPWRGPARRLARGLPRRPAAALDGSARAAVEASAAAVAAIVARGEPVYGINTGFGKLAIGPHRGRRPRDAPAQPRPLARRRASASRCRPPSCGWCWR